jgi:hypothetical protein
VTRLLLSTRRLHVVRVLGNRRNPRLVAAGESGQGTMEYVGMLIAVAVVVAGVIAVLKGVDVGGAVSNAFNKAFG